MEVELRKGSVWHLSTPSLDRGAGRFGRVAPRARAMVEAQTRQVSFARHTSHTIVPSRGGRGSATQWLRPPPGQRAPSFQAVIFSRSNSLLRSGNESFQPLRLFVLDIGLTSS